MVSQAPYSYSIYTATKTITSSTFTCTDAEKTTLKASIASVTQAIASVEAEVTHIQEVYECKFFIFLNTLSKFPLLKPWQEVKLLMLK